MYITAHSKAKFHLYDMTISFCKTERFRVSREDLFMNNIIIKKADQLSSIQFKNRLYMLTLISFHFPLARKLCGLTGYMKFTFCSIVRL